VIRIVLLAFSLLAVLPLRAGAIALAPLPAVPDTFSGNRRPAITAATNGAQFFVAWQEDLAYPGLHSPINFRTYLDNGAPQQALPLGAPGMRTPAVTWTGADWLLVSGWGPDNQVIYIPQSGPSLFGVAVHESGEIADSLITMASGTDAWGSAAIAWNGSVALASSGRTNVIAAADGRPLRELTSFSGVLASAGGNFLVAANGPEYPIVDGSGTLIRNVLTCDETGPTTCGGFGTLLAATGHGDEYALAFRSINGLTVVTLDSAGNIKSSADYAADLTHIGKVSIVWSGTSYVIAFIQTYPSKGFCLLRAEGSGTTRCMASSFDVSDVALAASNATLLVAWSEVHTYPNGGNPVPIYGDQVMTAFSAANDLPAEEAATAATTVMLPLFAQAMEADPKGVTVVWEEREDPLSDRVMVGGIDRSGTTRVPRVLGTQVRSNVRLARGTTSMMAVWSSVDWPSSEVYAREINDDGSFGPLLAVGNGDGPAVAFDGQDWLVVWESDQIMSALLRAHQVTAPVAQLLVPTGHQQARPAVASRGSDFLVTWLQYVPGAEYEYDGAFVDREGMTTTPPMLLATPTTTAWVLDVAASGSRYLLVIDDIFTPGPPIPGVLVRSVLADRQPRVRPRAGGGFAILFSTTYTTHFTTINAAGDVTLDTKLPYGTDFLEENGSVEVIYTADNGLGALYFDALTPRRRAVGSR
jgi:hypothetical protein